MTGKQAQTRHGRVTSSSEMINTQLSPPSWGQLKTHFFSFSRPLAPLVKPFTIQSACRIEDELCPRRRIWAASRPRSRSKPTSCVPLPVSVVYSSAMTSVGRDPRFHTILELEQLTGESFRLHLLRHGHAVLHPPLYRPSVSRPQQPDLPARLDSFPAPFGRQVAHHVDPVGRYFLR